jgi:hypothetical protein
MRDRTYYMNHDYINCIFLSSQIYINPHYIREQNGLYEFPLGMTIDLSKEFDRILTENLLNVCQVLPSSSKFFFPYASFYVRI